MEEEQVEVQDVVTAERNEIGAVYDRMMAEGVEDGDQTEEQPRGPDGKFVAKDAPDDDTTAEEAEVEADAETAEEPDEAAEEPNTQDEEQDKEPVEAPSYLPFELKQSWNDIPESARETIARTHQEFNDRLADQGRKLSAIEPIAEKVVEAAQVIPGLANMTPAQIANDVMGLAKVQADLMQNPVDTLLQVAAQYGAVEGLAAKLQGGEVPDQPNVVNEIRQLRMENEQLREQLNPDRIREITEQTLTERDIQRQIEEFAASQEHFATVEPHLVNFIPVAQQILGAGASKADILARSYEMAVNALGLKASAKDETPKADPERAKAAVKAKSVNVKSRSTGKSKPLTEREMMAQAYDRALAS